LSFNGLHGDISQKIEPFTSLKYDIIGVFIPVLELLNETGEIWINNDIHHVSSIKGARGSLVG
jgi:hypothetical protein